MSYIRTDEDGYDAAQHHADPSWPPDQRLFTKCVRVFGRDPSTLDLLIADGPGGNMPDYPNTVGYEIDRAVWFSSGAADPAGITSNTPFWGNAFPAVAQTPSGTTSDPYKSKVVSSVFALPAFDQDPSDPSVWRPDTGVIPQKVALPGGRQVAGGTPLIVLPFSITTEQQMAAFEATSDLIAVWRGGAPRGPMGTLVHEVTPEGDLDPIRQARDHSSWRVYRLPESGLLPFGAKTIGTSKPYPISSGLAWQLGLDIDGQAGYGAIVDRVSGAPPPTSTPEKTVTGVPATASPATVTGTPFGGVGQVASLGGSAGGGSGTVTGGFPGPLGVPQTQEKPKPADPPPQSGVVFGLTTRTAFGGHSVGQFVDKHRIAVTPDGEPVNCAHWNIRQPIDGDGFDAPFKSAAAWVRPNASGPLIVETFHAYDNEDSHEFLGGSRQGLRKWETRVPFDVPRKDDKQPGHDKSTNDKVGGTDKAQADKLGGTDKFFATDKIGNADKAIGDGENAKPAQDGSGLKVQGSDNLLKAGRDKVALDPATGPNDGPGPFFPPGGSAPGYEYSFGGGILIGGNRPIIRGGWEDWTSATIFNDRTYARTPLEVAGPGWLARAVPLYGFDLRGRGDALTDAQMASYKALAPISGVISAFCDQSSGGYRWFDGETPGSSLYLGGAANAGGFVLTPANVDAVRLQREGFVPEDMPFTSLLASTFYSFIGWADPHPSGRPMDGYVAGRGSNTTWSLDWFDSNGQTGELGVGALPPAIYLDSGQDPVDPPPSCLIWGGQVVTVWNTTAGQAPAGTVFVADGTNAGPGGTWQTPSSIANAGPGVWGSGSDGAYTLNGGAAGSGMTFDGAITYTLTRDVYASNLTMSGVYRLNTVGWRLFVSGTLTLGASNRIAHDGAAAVGGTPGTNGTPQTLGFGRSGGAGVARSAAGSTIGNAGSGVASSFGGSGGNGAVAGLGIAGGAGGAATAPASNFGELRQTPQITLAVLISYQGAVSLEGGAGGGSGACFYNVLDTGTTTSGGGGGGAGVVMIAAKILVNAGIISADGGPGGAASSTGVVTAGDAGGGGGGGGGLVVVVYGANGSTLGTVQANGGLGGAGFGAFINNGAPGTVGRTRILAL